MSYIQRYDFTLDVNASGAGTVYSADVVRGDLRYITYTPDGTNPLDTGADLTITGEVTGIALLTVTNIGTVAASWAPRIATCGLTTTASLYASGGTAVQDQIALAGERIKVVVAQGGASKTGLLSIFAG